MDLREQVTDIFVKVDDFCKELDVEIRKLKKISIGNNGKKTRNRQCTMSDAEILTIMIGFHLGHHKTFKHYYQNFVCEYWKDLFPKTLSYNRFVEIKHRYFLVFFYF